MTGKTVSYRVSFPDIEINSVDGYHAVNEAIEQLLKKQKDWPLLSEEKITWTETHNDECQCNACEDEK